MRKKLVFYTEIAYFVGLFLLAFGTALTIYGGFGVSMVVAPAYILHCFVSQYFEWFTFGMAEYVLQAFLLLLTVIILRKAKWTYLLSFVAAILYGVVLDASMKLTALFPQDVLALQIIVYIIGIIVCCLSIALLFSTYFPPEAYEMFVKEISAKFKKPIHKVKTFYDCGSLVVAILLCTILLSPLKADSIGGVFDNFMKYDIGIGTIVCAFIYGFIIKFFQKIYYVFFRFEDRFALRKYFEESEK